MCCFQNPVRNLNDWQYFLGIASLPIMYPCKASRSLFIHAWILVLEWKKVSCFCFANINMTLCASDFITDHWLNDKSLAESWQDIIHISPGSVCMCTLWTNQWRIAISVARSWSARVYWYNSPGSECLWICWLCPQLVHTGSGITSSMDYVGSSNMDQQGSISSSLLVRNSTGRYCFVCSFACHSKGSL